MIELSNVSYTYKIAGIETFRALNNINFKFCQNEIVGVIGHTGSGKSTLTQLLSGLLKPTSGKAYIDGKPIGGVRDLKGQVGIVFQYPEHQLFEETVYKDIAFGPKNMGLSKEQIHERVHEAASLVGLREGHLKKSPFELSGGQKRRAAIAGVLAMWPKYLILDEPTAGLDPKSRQSVLRRIAQLQKAKGMAVMMVSHSMEEVSNMAQRVLVLNKGEIYMEGTVSQIYNNPARLRSVGLDIPPINEIIIRLREMGLNISPEIFTASQAACEILRIYGERSA